MNHFKSLFAELFALVGVAVTWANAVLTFIQEITDILQIIGSTAALVVSVITARYYWIKTKKLKNDNP